MEEIKKMLAQFRDERDWLQFHDPKNLAEAISIEASELLELFLWKNKEEINKKINEESGYKERIAEELADVFILSTQMANILDFNVEDIILKKIKKTKEKYPVEKSKGSNKKYNEL